MPREFDPVGGVGSGNFRRFVGGGLGFVVGFGCIGVRALCARFAKRLVENHVFACIFEKI